MTIVNWGEECYAYSELGVKNVMTIVSYDALQCSGCLHRCGSEHLCVSHPHVPLFSLSILSFLPSARDTPVLIIAIVALLPPKS